MRERTGRNGRGSRVQKINAATRSRERETAAGFPEYGFRYSAIPRDRQKENHSAWKAGRSVRRDALTMTGGITNVLYHPVRRDTFSASVRESPHGRWKPGNAGNYRGFFFLDRGNAG
jgi:hypothetical protein